MKSVLSCMLVMFVLVTPAQALLINRGTDTDGNRLIYDNDRDITWYDYANKMENWATQVAWAGGLSVDFGGTTYDDWRLPTTVDGAWKWGYDDTPTITAGYNITSSEMGHLFYTELENLGLFNTSGSSQSGSGLSNKGDFQNLVSAYYWSGTDYSAADAWYFNPLNGVQTTLGKEYILYGQAVRSGDVAAASVPEPTTIALLGIGLAGMAVYGVGRRRQLR